MKSVMLSLIRTHKDDSRIGKNPNESGLFIRDIRQRGTGQEGDHRVGIFIEQVGFNHGLIS